MFVERRCISVRWAHLYAFFSANYNLICYVVVQSLLIPCLYLMRVADILWWQIHVYH